MTHEEKTERASGGSSGVEVATAAPAVTLQVAAVVPGGGNGGGGGGSGGGAGGGFGGAGGGVGGARPRGVPGLAGAPRAARVLAELRRVFLPGDRRSRQEGGGTQCEGGAGAGRHSEFTAGHDLKTNLLQMKGIGVHETTINTALTQHTSPSSRITCAEILLRCGMLYTTSFLHQASGSEARALAQVAPLRTRIRT